MAGRGPNDGFGCGSGRRRGEGGERRPVVDADDDEGLRHKRRPRGGASKELVVLAAIVALAFVSPVNSADDWRCPLFTQEGAAGGTSTPIILTAAGCSTTFSVIAKMTLAPDVDQVTLPIRPAGSTMSLETVSSTVADLTGIKTTNVRATFEWVPRLEDARAQDYILNFEGPLNFNCTVFRFIVRVEKCKYCIGDRDSLHTVAADFNTHWTQIWSSNPALMSPDYVGVGTKIALGNLFRTRFGDTWKAIAVRLGTTVDMIVRLNPDIDFTVVTGSEIPEGTEVCVMPETCPYKRTAFPGITW
jgi:hypothetical protein